MRTFRDLVFVVALATAISPVLSGARRPALDIAIQDGLPCFLIPGAEMKRDPRQRLQSIEVVPATDPLREVWLIQAGSAEGLPIKAGSCYVYGGAVSGAEGKAARELTPGELYLVSFNVTPSDPLDPTFGYSGSFCLQVEGSQRRLAAPAACRSK